MKNNLYDRSIEIILDNQAPIGAYIACPNFPSYHYSWMRDGSYIAYAMDIAGQHHSAAAFHRWVAQVVLERKELVHALADQEPAALVEKGFYLHTRFTMDGKEADEEWPNFQLDGFGTWLWALERHLALSGGAPEDNCLEAAVVVAQYLAKLWQTPCYDLWEEHPHAIHPYTLACITGGLTSMTAYLGQDYGKLVESIKCYLLDNYLFDGYITKFKGNSLVDASLIGLCIPYGLITPEHPVMQATIDQIEKQLIASGGLHRYAEDSYYGGGEWVLLSAWLGWYYQEIGATDKAEEMLRWIEAQADANLNLPEQVPHALNAPDKLAYWEKRWGPIASPLLWSHAKYIILKNRINRSV